ncbi:MAG: choice-of-anchor D domain-containing protein, partial [Sphingomonadales bacterium]
MYLQLQGIEKTGFSTSDKSPIHHACTWFQRFIFTIFIAIWLIFESASAQAQTPEIRVDGSVNGNFFIPIANGDTTPSLFDGTDIGRQSVGVPSTGRIFSINNTGSAPLTVSNISVSGANGGSFPYFIETSLTDIPPGEHGIVRIGFEPNFIGSHEATITFNSNDADDSAYTFSIRGDSIAANTPDILVSGKDVEIINGDGTPSTTDATDLGTIHIGGTQSSRFLIRNIGTSSLSLSSVVLGGPNANQFTITQQPPSIIGSTANYIQLPGSPGSDLVIEYQPTVAGTHIATVEITSNDPDETPFTYFIQGVATASLPQPEIAVLGNLFTASPQEISAGDMTASTFDGTVFGDVIIGAP